MELEIKQLKQGNQIIVPQTTAEAVLVKTDSQQIIRLDQALSSKSGIIITPDNSGLTISNKNGKVEINHSTIIAPNKDFKSLKVKYNSSGHIVETTPVSKLNVIVNNSKIEYNGDEEKSISFGDNFIIDNNNIELTWKNIENGTT